MVAYLDTSETVVRYTIYTYGHGGSASTETLTTEPSNVMRGRIEVVVVEERICGSNDVPQCDPPPCLFCSRDIWDVLRAAQPRQRQPRVARLRHHLPPRADQRWASAVRSFA